MSSFPRFFCRVLFVYPLFFAQDIRRKTLWQSLENQGMP
jgi:hypothetical protein